MQEAMVCYPEDRLGTILDISFRDSYFYLDLRYSGRVFCLLLTTKHTYGQFMTNVMCGLLILFIVYCECIGIHILQGIRMAFSDARLTFLVTGQKYFTVNRKLRDAIKCKIIACG